jgi:hypothetical protein
VASTASGSSNTIAIVAIAAGASVGLVGSWVAVWTHRSQLRFQQQEADRSELKALLDAILQGIYQAQMSTGHLVGIAYHAGNDEDPSVRWQGEAPEYGDRLSEIYLQIMSDLTRLGLRLGDAGGPIVDLVANKSNDISAAARMCRARVGVHGQLSEHFDAIQQCRLEFTQLARRFSAARLS